MRATLHTWLWWSCEKASHDRLRLSAWYMTMTIGAIAIKQSLVLQACVPSTRRNSNCGHCSLEANLLTAENHSKWQVQIPKYPRDLGHIMNKNAASSVIWEFKPGPGDQSVRKINNARCELILPTGLMKTLCEINTQDLCVMSKSRDIAMAARFWKMDMSVYNERISLFRLLMKEKKLITC